MADLIDRQKIKARFEPWLKVQGYSEGELNMLKAVLYEITIMPSAQPDVPDTNVGDMISRQAAIDVFDEGLTGVFVEHRAIAEKMIGKIPSAQPERLTDDDFETIRIHLNAYKEKLCNQHRWKEAEEYQRTIDRFMAFASAQPARHGRWERRGYALWTCNLCGCRVARSNPLKGSIWNYNYCPNCGARMDGEQK